jgi:hypothetical protein
MILTPMQGEIFFEVYQKNIKKPLLMVMKRLLIEENQNPNTCRNRHIGNVENRIEEFKVMSAPNREPFWKISFK